MRTIRTEVLVVGGGPAGATAAFQLATAGIDVTLVDRARFPRDKTCGESLSPGAISRLEAIGMWRPEADPAVDASTRGHTIRGMRIRSPCGTSFLGRYKPGPDGRGLAIRRSVLDDQLLERTRALGAQVLQEMEATSAEAGSTGASVRCRGSAGGDVLLVEARRVVVADGRQSFLARHLGFIEARSTGRGARRYAVRAHFEGLSNLSDLAEMHVGDRGYCGIAPLSPTAANVCYVLFTDRPDLTPGTLEADFRRHVRGYPEISERLEAARFDGPIRVVGPLRIRSERQSAGPFIACGDTTGFLDPFTGEGIAHAIASGVLGAAAVRASLGGRVGSFREYEREIRRLRRTKGMAALLLYGLVSHRALANGAASLFARAPRLASAAVQLFGDQV